MIYVTDPVSYMDGLLKLKSQQRVELSNLENKIDTEHAQQLAAAREPIVEDALNKLNTVEEDFLQRLEEKGE